MTILTVYLKGGLGNQLFQICAVLAHAMKHGMEFQFQNCPLLFVGQIRPTYWDTLFSEIKPFLRDLHGFLGIAMYTEPTFTYVPLPVFTTDTMLKGYFQSIKYFQDELPIILQLLNMRQKIQDIKDRFADIFECNVTCMHFRITGYRGLEDFHPVAPYQYYVASLRKLSPERVLYFHQPEDTEEVTDMIARMSLEFPRVSFNQAPPLLQDYEQLLLMACCQQHIIANSSFSWWGAVLAESKHVCYPETWFGPAAPHDIKDLVSVFKIFL